MFSRSPEELKKLKDTIITTFEDSGLAGKQIFHGTDKSHIESVRQGPKDYGKGFGGPGLNVTPHEMVAVSFSGPERPSVRCGSSFEEGVVMCGEFNTNPQMNYRVLGVKNEGYGGGINSDGTFPRFWSTRPDVVKFVTDNSDIVHIIPNWLDLPDFYVIRESAGPNVINWLGYKPLLNPERVKFYLASSSLNAQKYFSDTVLCERRAFAATYLSSSNLRLRMQIPVDTLDMVRFNPPAFQYFDQSLPKQIFQNTTQKSWGSKLAGRVLFSPLDALLNLMKSKKQNSIMENVNENVTKGVGFNIFVENNDVQKTIKPTPEQAVSISSKKLNLPAGQLKQGQPLKEHCMAVFGVPELPPLFENVIKHDIHEPFPHIKKLTVEDIRQTPCSGEPECFKYVILDDGSLVISSSYRALSPIFPDERHTYNPDYIDLHPEHKTIKGIQYKWGCLFNNVLIYFDAEGKVPKFLQAPLKHPEIAKGAPVVFAGDFYVMNGKIIRWHPSGNFGIDNWTGHYLCSGVNQKQMVEHVFRNYGFEEDEIFFRDRAAVERNGKTNNSPMIIVRQPEENLFFNNLNDITPEILAAHSNQIVSFNLISCSNIPYTPVIRETDYAFTGFTDDLAKLDNDHKKHYFYSKEEALDSSKYQMIEYSGFKLYTDLNLGNIVFGLAEKNGWYISQMSLLGNLITLVQSKIKKLDIFILDATEVILDVTETTFSALAHQQYHQAGCYTMAAIPFDEATVHKTTPDYLRMQKYVQWNTVNTMINSERFTLKNIPLSKGPVGFLISYAKNKALTTLPISGIKAIEYTPEGVLAKSVYPAKTGIFPSQHNPFGQKKPDVIYPSQIYDTPKNFNQKNGNWKKNPVIDITPNKPFSGMTSLLSRGGQLAGGACLFNAYVNKAHQHFGTPSKWVLSNISTGLMGVYAEHQLFLALGSAGLPVGVVLSLGLLANASEDFWCVYSRDVNEYKFASLSSAEQDRNLYLYGNPFGTNAPRDYLLEGYPAQLVFAPVGKLFNWSIDTIFSTLSLVVTNNLLEDYSKQARLIKDEAFCNISPHDFDKNIAIYGNPWGALGLEKMPNPIFMRAYAAQFVLSSMVRVTNDNTPAFFGLFGLGMEWLKGTLTVPDVANRETLLAIHAMNVALSELKNMPQQYASKTNHGDILSKTLTPLSPLMPKDTQDNNRFNQRVEKSFDSALSFQANPNSCSFASLNIVFPADLSRLGNNFKPNHHPDSSGKPAHCPMMHHNTFSPAAHHEDKPVSYDRTELKSCGAGAVLSAAWTISPQYMPVAFAVVAVVAGLEAIINQKKNKEIKKQNLKIERQCGSIQKERSKCYRLYDDVVTCRDEYNKASSGDKPAKLEALKNAISVATPYLEQKKKEYSGFVTNKHNKMDYPGEHHPNHHSKPAKATRRVLKDSVIYIGGLQKSVLSVDEDVVSIDQFNGYTDKINTIISENIASKNSLIDKFSNNDISEEVFKKEWMTISDRDSNQFNIQLYNIRLNKNFSPEMESGFHDVASGLSDTDRLSHYVIFQAMATKDVVLLSNAFNDAKTLGNRAERHDFMTRCLFELESINESQRLVDMKLAHPDAMKLLEIDKWADLLKVKMDRLAERNEQLASGEVIAFVDSEQNEANYILETLLSRMNYETNRGLLHAINWSNNFHLAFDLGFMLIKDKIKNTLALQPAELKIIEQKIGTSGHIKHLFTHGFGLLKALVMDAINNNSVNPDSLIQGSFTFTEQQKSNLLSIKKDVSKSMIHSIPQGFEKNNSLLVACRLGVAAVDFLLHQMFVSYLHTDENNSLSFDDWFKNYVNEDWLSKSTGTLFNGFKNGLYALTFVQTALPLFTASFDRLTLVRKMVNTLFSLPYFIDFATWLADSDGTDVNKIILKGFINNFIGSDLQQLVNTHDDTILHGMAEVLRYSPFIEATFGAAALLNGANPVILNAFFFGKVLYSLTKAIMDSGDVPNNIAQVTPTVVDDKECLSKQILVPVSMEAVQVVTEKSETLMAEVKEVSTLLTTNNRKMAEKIVGVTSSLKGFGLFNRLDLRSTITPDSENNACQFGM